MRSVEQMRSLLARRKQNEELHAALKEQETGHKVAIRKLELEYADRVSQWKEKYKTSEENCRTISKRRVDNNNKMEA